jgi:uncharacterized membrane protein
MVTLINYIKADFLAFIVLVVLVFCTLATFFINSKSNQESGRRGLYSILFILFPFIGFPAALDLMTTTGYTKFFAIIIFVILLIPIIVALISLVQKRTLELLDKAWEWFVLPFIAGGLIVSGYLTYVELTSSTAVCGVAIPGCGEVQSSPYAVLFGFLPVALLGVIGYVGILIAWLGKRVLPLKYQKLLNIGMWGLGFFGIIFSIYLTYLEVFVLHATCTWCILAAVFMIMLFWISIQDAQEYFSRDQDEEEEPA